MDNEKRLFLAIALSVVVILGYQAYMRKASKPYQVQGQVATEQASLPATVSRQQPATVSPALPQVKQGAAKEETAVFENAIYRAIFTNYGGGMRELLMKREGEEGQSPILIAGTHGSGPAILATEEIAGGQSPLDWQLISVGNDTVIYRAEDQSKLIEKVFTFHNSNYIIELEQTIKNKSAVKTEQQYKLTGGQVKLTGMQMYDMHVGADVKVDQKVYRQKPNTKKNQDSRLFQGAPAWASTRSRYFSFVLKPEQVEQGAFIESIDKKVAWSGILLGPVSLQPGESIDHRYQVYAGPNNPKLMVSINIPPKEIVGYWATSGIAKLLLQGIRFFHSITKSYGVAIILLTIIISALLLPLTRKSMQSMKEMQKIQPEVEKIKKEHSSDPQKMNKEIMELYRTHKINPLGGCLPMFLQFPIFVSLFQALPRSIELKGAHFLWIKDLSSPDALFTLSRSLPVIQDKINILPILMAIAMAVQQKVSHPGGEVSEQQKMMSVMMPVVFGFIFYNMASGLVLYWLTNTVFTLVMQEVVLKSRQPAQ